MRVLIIDDHEVLREGLISLLKRLGPDMEFVEVGKCEDVLPPAPIASGIQLILLDLGLPGVSGLQALRKMREAYESSIIVVVSGEEDPQVIRRAIEEGGATGFVPKASSSDVLLAALSLILAGGTYLPPDVLLANPTARPSPEVDLKDEKRSINSLLTPQQRCVLLKAVQGKPNKVIAREMNLAEGTVKVHLSASFRVLGVQNRTEAVMVAAKLGLTEQELPQ